MIDIHITEGLIITCLVIIRTITVRKQFRTGELFKQLSRTELNCLNSSVQLTRTVRTVLSNWAELIEQFSSAQENCQNSSFELSWTVVVLVLKVLKVPYRIALASYLSWAELFEQFSSVPKNCSNSSGELNWTVWTVRFSSKELFKQFSWAELNCSNSSAQFERTVRTVLLNWTELLRTVHRFVWTGFVSWSCRSPIHEHIDSWIGYWRERLWGCTDQRCLNFFTCQCLKISSCVLKVRSWSHKRCIPTCLSPLHYVKKNKHEWMMLLKALILIWK
jgi:hypothetical protein